jgi:hypothetical protein
MLNRSNPAVREALDARHAISLEIRERLRELPPTPFDWSTFDPQDALLGHAATPDLRLGTLARTLCVAPARAAELRALWKECVATAAYAIQLAPLLNADVTASAIAGLLHRLGDMLTIRAIATFEHAERQRLDGASKADLCAAHGGELLDRVVRAWGVPPRAAATAAEWRRLREFPGAAAEATAVYLARLLAIEAISPEFCAPGLIDRAAEEVGLDAGKLDSVRNDAAVRSLITNIQ